MNNHETVTGPLDLPRVQNAETLSKHVGARAELLACAWFLANGYEVFRNVSYHGKTDLVVEKDGQLTRYDIKAVRAHRMKNGRYTAGTIVDTSRIQEGIKIAFVADDGRVFFNPDEAFEYVCGRKKDDECSRRRKVIVERNRERCGGDWQTKKRRSNPNVKIGSAGQEMIRKAEP